MLEQTKNKNMTKCNQELTDLQSKKQNLAKAKWTYMYFYFFSQKSN